MDSDLFCLLLWNLPEAILTGQILYDIICAETKVSRMLSLFNPPQTKTILGSRLKLSEKWKKQWDGRVEYEAKVNIVLE